MFIVYVSSGSYSDYFVEDEVLVGDVEPLTVLDAWAAKATDGECETFDALERALAAASGYSGMPHKKEEQREKRKHLESIRQQSRQALTDAGFKPTKAMELWLGY